MALLSPSLFAYILMHPSQAIFKLSLNLIFLNPSCSPSFFSKVLFASFCLVSALPHYVTLWHPDYQFLNYSTEHSGCSYVTIIIQIFQMELPHYKPLKYYMNFKLIKMSGSAKVRAFNLSPWWSHKLQSTVCFPNSWVLCTPENVPPNHLWPLLGSWHTLTGTHTHTQ